MSLASEDLSDRIRDLLPPMLPTSEKKMFGGRCFMLAGNMLVCPMKDGSMLVRVGKDGMDESLSLPGAAPMSVGDRMMGGFVQVSGDVLEDDDTLLDWIGRARHFVDALPPK